MATDGPKKGLNDLDLLGSTFAELRGRQSVRATFKLTSDCIDAISIVAAMLGIKQKSLFDHLFEDTNLLSNIAKKFRNTRLQTSNRTQKTYVMSRSALLSLDDIAKHFNAPRDALIEISVQRLLPIITNERKRYETRKAIFAKIERHLEEGRQLLKSAYAELGEEDQITDRLTAAMGMYESAFKQMAVFMDRSKGIEDFDPRTLTTFKIEIEEG